MKSVPRGAKDIKMPSHETQCTLYTFLLIARFILFVTSRNENHSSIVKELRIERVQRGSNLSEIIFINLGSKICKISMRIRDSSLRCEISLLTSFDECEIQGAD